MGVLCNRPKGLVFPFLLVLGLLLSVSASAQITSQTGAVRVLVTDPTGAAVAGAKVTLSSAVSADQIKETISDGSVVFPLVTPGTYKVTVEAPNFNRSLLNNVSVEVTAVTNLSVKLEIGQVSTEVLVSADAVETVNTTNATLGDVLSGDVLHNLPLGTRNFTFLLALNAGTSAPLPDATQAGRGTATVFVDGQRGTNNNLVINGTDANNLANNNLGNVAIPSPDSLEEFRVQTSLYDASQGKTSGGNINVLTRGAQIPSTARPTTTSAMTISTPTASFSTRTDLRGRISSKTSLGEISAVPFLSFTTRSSSDRTKARGKAMESQAVSAPSFRFCQPPETRPLSLPLLARQQIPSQQARSIQSR
jgi:hypothetical protein